MPMNISEVKRLSVTTLSASLGFASAGSCTDSVGCAGFSPTSSAAQADSGATTNETVASAHKTARFIGFFIKFS